MPDTFLSVAGRRMNKALSFILRNAQFSRADRHARRSLHCRVDNNGKTKNLKGEDSTEETVINFCLWMWWVWGKV